MTDIDVEMVLLKYPKILPHMTLGDETDRNTNVSVELNIHVNCRIDPTLYVHPF